VPAEELLEIGEEEAVRVGQLRDAAVEAFRRRRSSIAASRDSPSSRRPTSLWPSLGS
jgi:hypothetical protein